MKPTILVVDDEPNIRELAIRVLGDAGYEVVTAGTLQDATQLADHRDPDLLLVDVRLRNFNGLQLVVMERTKGRKRPIVVMSGYHDPFLVAQAARFGATYLQKPFRAGQLTAMIEQLLAAARDTQRAGEIADRGIT